MACQQDLETNPAKGGGPEISCPQDPASRDKIKNFHMVHLKGVLKNSQPECTPPLAGCDFSERFKWLFYKTFQIS
jgi:hypothetical protein